MRTSDADAAFLPAILARPGDDGPRLILADYLDESNDLADQARAEFIRIQCALVRLAKDHPRRILLANQETDLLNRYQVNWTEPLRSLAVGFEWRRGILDSVTVDAAAFLSTGSQLFHRAPIRRVRILEAVHHIERLATCPLLAGIRELDLCGNDLGNGGLNLLLRSRYLDRIESLDLSFNGIGDGGLSRLADSPALPRLRTLALSDNGSIGGEGVRFLAESAHRSELRVLDLSGNDVNDVGVRALVESRFLTHLQTCHLYANHIGDAGVIALVGSNLLRRHLNRHAHLDLRQNGIGPAGAEILSAARPLSLVRSLDLSDNYLGSVGLTVLAASRHLSRVRRLAVRRNQVSDAGALSLAGSELMTRLRELDISENRLTRRGVDALWNARGNFQTVLETGGNLVASAPNELPEQRTEETRREQALAPPTRPIGTVLRPKPASSSR